MNLNVCHIHFINGLVMLHTTGSAYARRIFVVSGNESDKGTSDTWRPMVASQMDNIGGSKTTTTSVGKLVDLDDANNSPSGDSKL